MKLLQDLLRDAASVCPDATALRGPDGVFSYREMDRLSNCMANAMRRLGVAAGDRVALWGEKSCRLVSAMQGALRIGAAYVPIDSRMPVYRVRAIMEDCTVRCIVTDRNRSAALFGEATHFPVLFVEDAHEVIVEPLEGCSHAAVTCNDLAYILYTSGSTGPPKGVCISHRNALAFVEWAVEAVSAGEQSRFSNHAAFNFDLSVFDLYGAFLSRGCVSIVPEAVSSAPRQLIEFMRQERITIWYSVPSALTLMIEHGNLLLQRGLALRTIIFAGEVFPIRQLRAMREAWPDLDLWNFYGPTETNVCTAYRVEHIPADRTSPVPIGRACSGDRVWLRGKDGQPTVDCEGELVVEGPTVMLGYWGADSQDSRPYATGDICRIERDGNLVYVGRTDHMIKLHGYRIEPGEVEAALASHPGLCDAAVIVSGEGAGARLVAFVVSRDSSAPTLIALKTHCARLLPPYMLINFAFPLPELPRTPNGKVDRHLLQEIARKFFQRSDPMVGS